jgi:geranylgeranyl diphosphate synthase, type I
MNITAELQVTQQRLRSYLQSLDLARNLLPGHLRQAAQSYVEAGGKYLRPCLLLWCCRALGGNEAEALPAALAVEIFHTWTLVHDDIIDRDVLRRGGPTVHEDFRRRGEAEFGLKESAGHYGLSIALLAGDVQHGWAITLLSQAGAGGDEARASLALGLVRELEGEVLAQVIGGEALDLELSCRPLDQVSETEVMQLIAAKTAALLAFSARAGALLGLGSYAPEHPQVAALETFGRCAGIAFQLQDDILGLVGKEAKLGKPVGSDIREGKRTLALAYAWRQADAAARRRLQAIVGNSQASEALLAEAAALVETLGGLAYARQVAEGQLALAQQALQALGDIPEKELLHDYARLMLERSR